MGLRSCLTAEIASESGREPSVALGRPWPLFALAHCFQGPIFSLIDNFSQTQVVQF